MTSGTRIQSPRRALTWGGVLLGVLACATLAVHAEDEEDNEAQGNATGDPVFYPPAPDEPRVQYLRSFGKEEEPEVKRGRFRKFIVGEEKATKKPKALGRPYGIAVHDGRIFVCDLTELTVQIIDIETGVFTEMGRGTLKLPVNITIDADGTRYIADRRLKRVMVYSPKGQPLAGYPSDDESEMAPTDVAIHEDGLYVCDIDAGQVVVLDKRTGEELRRVGQPGSGDGELSMPVALDVDADGNVYVVDQMNARVLKYNSRGDYVQQFGARGDTPGTFFRPKGVAVDRKGRVYVVDAIFENVQIFDRDGRLLLPFTGTSVVKDTALPAAVAIDYDNVKYFEDLVAPGHEIEYLILVSSQYGPHKVSVYGFLKKNE